MKKIYQNITLTCVLQQDAELVPTKCLTGDITMTASGPRFEEEVRTEPKPTRRNPKLYNGTHLSMVRRPDNTVKFFFKDMPEKFDPKKFPKEVSNEVKEALKKLD